MLGQLGEEFPWVRIPDDLAQGGGSGQARYNIAPSQEVLGIVASGEGEQFVLDRLLWGLIPSWAKDPAIGNRMINARAESLDQKPAFRSALRRRRCVIPADGFYEWKKEGKGKQPYFVHMKNSRPFGFAGLWESWHDEAGSEVRSCTIITTEPNDLVKDIHNRMPAILAADKARHWVEGGERPAAELLTMLKPYPADEMEAYPVSRAVNNPKSQGPQCAQRATEGARGLWG
jgi:putative SOS response-associated peptidase YedK